MRGRPMIADKRIPTSPGATRSSTPCLWLAPPAGQRRPAAARYPLIRSLSAAAKATPQRMPADKRILTSPGATRSSSSALWLAPPADQRRPAAAPYPLVRSLSAAAKATSQPTPADKRILTSPGATRLSSSALWLASPADQRRPPAALYPLIRSLSAAAKAR